MGKPVAEASGSPKVEKKDHPPRQIEEFPFSHPESKSLRDKQSLAEVRRMCRKYGKERASNDRQDECHFRIEEQALRPAGSAKETSFKSRIK